jgi:hypothetical protein
MNQLRLAGLVSNIQRRCADGQDLSQQPALTRLSRLLADL